MGHKAQRARERKDHKQVEDIEKGHNREKPKKQRLFRTIGGSLLPEPIQNLLNQLETFEQYKNDQNLSQNTNII